MNIPHCRITLLGELANEFGRRTFYRTVYDAALTGHVSVGWQGTQFPQWKGYVQINNEHIDVWAYTNNEDETPTSWANDTF